MLERADEPVASALLAMAAQQQVGGRAACVPQHQLRLAAGCQQDRGGWQQGAVGSRGGWYQQPARSIATCRQGRRRRCRPTTSCFGRGRTAPSANASHTCAPRWLPLCMLCMLWLPTPSHRKLPSLRCIHTFGLCRCSWLFPGWGFQPRHAPPCATHPHLPSPAYPPSCWPQVDFNAWYASELRLILQSTELTGERPFDALPAECSGLLLPRAAGGQARQVGACRGGRNQRAHLDSATAPASLQACTAASCEPARCGFWACAARSCRRHPGWRPLGWWCST